MTSHAMTSNRVLRNVPLDFSWPRGKRWQGYVMPQSYRLDECSACEGSGASPEYRAIERDFYDFGNAGRRWCDNIEQDEVDNLQKEGRLRTWAGPDRRWIVKPLTAEFVNACNGHGPARNHDYTHDAINRHILVKYRCAKAGHETDCAYCHGRGDVSTAEQRDRHESWTPTDPPTGDGIQLWETTTEGSPCSPVFEDTTEGRKELANWLVVNPQGGTSDFTYETWMRLLMAGEDEEVLIDMATGQLVEG